MGIDDMPEKTHLGGWKLTLQTRGGFREQQAN
jgi:hypothetical protein